MAENAFKADWPSFALGFNTGKSKGGGGSGKPVVEKDVNFYDYDGTLLHSYTMAEAQALTDLPELPTREGLICQEWNYDLDTIKSYNRAMNVGATYITDDGKTRLYIKIATEYRTEINVRFGQTIANGVTIDWGDGSATETANGTGTVSVFHTYATSGNYVITLDPEDGCGITLGVSSSGGTMMGSSSFQKKFLRKVEIGKNVNGIHYYAFNSCHHLESITIPNSVNSIAGYGFAYCYALKSVVIPNSVTTIGEYALSNAHPTELVIISNSVQSIGKKAFYKALNIDRVVIPNSVRSIGQEMFYECLNLEDVAISNRATSIDPSAFYGCYGLTHVVIPNSVMTIATKAFSGCSGMKVYDFSTHSAVPTLGSTDAFANIPTDCEIRVPSALYDTWKSATNWGTYADRIVAV